MTRPQSGRNDNEQYSAGYITLKEIKDAFDETSYLMSSKVLEVMLDVQGHKQSRKRRLYKLDTAANKIIDVSSNEVEFIKTWLSKDILKSLGISNNGSKQKVRRFANDGQNAYAKELFSSLKQNRLEKSLFFNLCENIRHVIEIQVWSIWKRETRTNILPDDVKHLSEDLSSARIQNACICFSNMMFRNLIKIASLNPELSDSATRQYFKIADDSIILLTKITFMALFHETDKRNCETTFNAYMTGLFSITSENEWRWLAEKYCLADRQKVFEAYKGIIIGEEHTIIQNEENQLKKYVPDWDRISHGTDYLQVFHQSDSNTQVVRDYYMHFMKPLVDWNDCPIPLYVNLALAPQEYCSDYEEGRCTYIRGTIMKQLKSKWRELLVNTNDDHIRRRVLSDIEAAYDALFLEKRPDGIKGYILFLDGFDQLPDVAIKHYESTGWRTHCVVNTTIKSLLLDEINILFKTGAKNEKWENVQLAFLSRDPIGELSDWKYQVVMV